MMRKYFYLVIICFSFISAKSQYYHDIGFIVGNTFFASDYGEAGNFKNFYANNGISVGAVYYISLENDLQRSWKDYFKVRAELMFMHSNLQHHGTWVDPSRTGLFANQLRAMRGSTNVGNVGVQLEFYPLKTDDNHRGFKCTPYGSIGFQLNGFASKSSSTLGTLGNLITTPVKYLNATRSESAFTTSFSIGAGTRYRLGNYHSLVFDARLLRYNSDWVDGMNPDRTIYTENKANDYSLTLSFGYIYLLM